MNRSVTPPADGAECGFADRIEIAPQESRRRSRLGCATAVTSLARHGIARGRSFQGRVASPIVRARVLLL